MERILQQFLTEHGKLIEVGGIWFAISILVNVLLLLKGPQGWVDQAKKNPTAALIINILFRAFGIDLVGVILHFRDYMNAKAAAKPASSTPVEEKKS
jgi:fumarate reductase subunit C